MDKIEATKQLAVVWKQGREMRAKYGGTTTTPPKFPDKAASDKYAALATEYRKLQAIVKPFAVSAGIGVGAVALIALVAFFALKKKKA